jgi:SAM-dependent methyltransferase
MSSAFQPRFGHAAEEFQRYRPDYPPELFEHILSWIPIERRHRAMDLGAGTGKSARWLAKYFSEVIAVEPDAGMAAKLAEEVPEARVRNCTAEECSQAEGSVDLVTIGNALHWMDSARVFGNTHGWLRAGGILAVYDRPLPKCTPEIDTIILAELRGTWKPYRDPRLKKDAKWEDAVRAAPGFQVVEDMQFSYIINMPPDEYAGFWRSTSYGSAYARTLENAESYWRELESRFAAVSGGKLLPVDFSPTLVVSRKI